MADGADEGRSLVRDELELLPARLSDAETIAVLSRDVIEVGLRWVWRPRSIAREILRSDTEVLVARMDGRMVGFAIMRFLEDDAHLLLLGVAPGHQRTGIGRKLMSWLEKCARVAGISSIQLQVRAANTRARAFYRALGYSEVKVSRRYYQGFEDAVVMICHL